MTTITDTIAGVLRAHRSVTGVMTKRLDGIVGCRCMNRVFFSGEDYPSHLAEVIAAAIEPEIRADECRKAAEEVENVADVLYLQWRADQREKATT